MAKKQKPIHWDDPVLEAFWGCVQKKHPYYQLTYTKLITPISPFGMHWAEGFIVDGVEYKLSWSNLQKFF